MTWHRQLAYRLRSLFNRDSRDAEQAEEIRLHLEMQTVANIAAGMTPEEARQSAQKEFGGMVRVQEECRDERSFVWLEHLLRDLRFACTSLRRAPVFSLGVIATLAIGIGATTAMLSIALSVFRYQHRMVQDDRTFDFTEKIGTPEYRYSLLFKYRFASYATAIPQSFEWLGAVSQEPMNLLISGQPAHVYVTWETRRERPEPLLLGRTFASDEFKAPDQVNVALLGYKTWIELFSRDPNIVGKDISVGSRMLKVIGVEKMQRGLPGIGNDSVHVTLPVAWSPVRPQTYKMYDWVMATGRLKPGVTLAQARAELAGLKIGDSGDPRTFSNAVPEIRLRRDGEHPDFVNRVPLFLGAVLLLYAIACTNAANLVFTRAISRRHELGVRLALGGGQWQIMRLLLAESLILAFCAALAGMFVAHWGGSLICSYLSTPADSSFDFAPVWIVFCVTCLTGMIIGFLPAWLATRSNLSDALKTGPHALGSNKHVGALRESLVIAQTALVVALLAGAGLMLQSMSKLNRTGVGFDPSSKVSVHTYLPYATTTQKYMEVSVRGAAELSTISGVQRVSTQSFAPLMGTSSGSVRIDGEPEIGDIMVHSYEVSPDYFAVLGMTLIKGRGFEGIRPTDKPVAIINTSMEKRFFPKEGGAFGHYLKIGQDLIEIIGVVNDVREAGPKEEMIPQIYRPFCQQRWGNSVSWILQLPDSRLAGLEGAVRSAIYRVDPTLVVYIQSLQDSYNRTISTERFTLVLLQVFSGLALVLASLGLFSVMAYNVAQRRGEFGLRMALGATPDDLLRSVLGRGLRTVAIGIAIGLGLAFFLTRFLQSLLYQTSPLDPLTYSVVVLLFLVVAILACWLPARRAALTDPMVALRCE